MYRDAGTIPFFVGLVADRYVSAERLLGAAKDLHLRAIHVDLQQDRVGQIGGHTIHADELAFVGLAVILYVAVEMVYRGALEVAPVVAN